MYLDTSFYREQIEINYNYPIYPTTQKEWDHINSLQKSVRRHSKTAMGELLRIFHPLFISTAKSLTGERETLNFVSSRLKDMYNGYANLKCSYEEKDFIDIYICIAMGFIKATNAFTAYEKRYTYDKFILSNLHLYIQTELRSYITRFYKKTNYIRLQELNNRDLIDIDQEISLLKSEEINYTDNDFALKLKQHSNIISDDIFDLDWINGVTCNAPFDILTIREREILVMFYIDEMKATQIGEYYDVSNFYINKTLQNIKAKLRRKI